MRDLRDPLLLGIKLLSFPKRRRKLSRRYDEHANELRGEWLDWIGDGFMSTNPSSHHSKTEQDFSEEAPVSSERQIDDPMPEPWAGAYSAANEEWIARRRVTDPMGHKWGCTAYNAKTFTVCTCGRIHEPDFGLAPEQSSPGQETTD